MNSPLPDVYRPICERCRRTPICDLEGFIEGLCHGCRAASKAVLHDADAHEKHELARMNDDGCPHAGDA